MDLFSKDYKSKRESYKELKITVDQMNDDILTEFYKCMTADSINALVDVINKTGHPPHKEHIQSFLGNYKQGFLCDSDFDFIEKMLEIYGSKIKGELIKDLGIMEE